jgi:hypothetical protein
MLPMYKRYKGRRTQLSSMKEPTENLKSNKQHDHKHKQKKNCKCGAADMIKCTVTLGKQSCFTNSTLTEERLSLT